MNAQFSQLAPEIKEVLYVAFCYHTEIKDQKILAKKRKEFSLEMEYCELDLADKGVLSLLLGLLSFENSVTKRFLERGITKQTVLDYLNLENINFQEITTESLAKNIDFVKFLEKNIKEDSTLEKIAGSLYRNFVCESDVIANLYYDKVTLERAVFNEDKTYFLNKKRIKIANIFAHSANDFDALVAE